MERTKSTSSQRVIEWEMDLPRIVFLGVLALGALAGAFGLGRWTAPKAQEATLFAPTSSMPVGADEEAIVDVTDQGTIFDRAGDGAAERVRNRQMTREVVSAGRFEVEVGSTPKRSEAEAWRMRLKKLGFDSYLVHTRQGVYRVAAGPFETEKEARRVSERLAKVLGRSTRVTRGSEAR